MARALWNGTIIAESDDIEVVEGNLYFPRESILCENFVESQTTTHCPWKGDASYFDVVVDGKTNADAAWYYPAPKDAAANITGRVAFWKGVTIER
jgi:uncharacterized protein (DUF427 family)